VSVIPCSQKTALDRLEGAFALVTQVCPIQWEQSLP
jgi:hypothetical protein